MAPLSAARGLLAAAFQRVGGLKNLFTSTRPSYSQQACVSKTHPTESSPTARYHTPSTSLDKLPSIGPNSRRRSGVPIYSHPGSAIKKYVSGPSSLEKQARKDRIQKGLLQSNEITEKEAPVASTHATPSSSSALASYKEHHVKATKIAGSRRVSHPAGQLRSAIKKQRSGPSSATKHARQDRIIAGLLKEDEGSDTKVSIYTSVSAVFPSSFSTPGSMIEDDIPLDDLDPPFLQMPRLSIEELGDLPDPAYFNDELEVEVAISTEAEDEVLKDVEPSEGFDREFVDHIYDLNPSGNANEASATEDLQSLEMADGPSNDNSWVGNQLDGSGDVELTDLDAPPAPADDHGSVEDFSRFPSGSPAYEPAPLDCPWYPQDLDVSSKKKLELFREWLIAESYQDSQPMAKIEALESAREALMTPEEDMDHYTYSVTNSDDEKGPAEEPLESTDDSTSPPQDSQMNINFAQHLNKYDYPAPSPALREESRQRTNEILNLPISQMEKEYLICVGDIRLHHVMSHELWSRRVPLQVLYFTELQSLTPALSSIITGAEHPVLCAGEIRMCHLENKTPASPSQMAARKADRWAWKCYRWSRIEDAHAGVVRKKPWKPRFKSPLRKVMRAKLTIPEEKSIQSYVPDDMSIEPPLMTRGKKRLREEEDNGDERVAKRQRMV